LAEVAFLHPVIDCIFLHLTQYAFSQATGAFFGGILILYIYKYIKIKNNNFVMIIYKMDSLINLFSKTLKLSKSSSASSPYRGLGTKRSRGSDPAFRRDRGLVKKSKYSKTKNTTKKSLKHTKTAKKSRKTAKKTVKIPSPVDNQDVEMTQRVTTRRGREVKKPELYKPS